jgi:hypothetical protein
MNEINSLVIFTKAALMLAEADTIQKAKELKNLALTAADWAKRKGMGEKAILYARSYALRAERKMGEMLADKDLRQKPGEYKKLHDETFCPKPSLSDLGLTKIESFRAQKLADIDAGKNAHKRNMRQKLCPFSLGDITKARTSFLDYSGMGI